MTSVVVASPLPTGFGMPKLTYLGADVLRLPFIRKTSLGHEILHNWWRNGVYVDYTRGNWSEGLTTFMADYAYKEDESAAAASRLPPILRQWIAAQSPQLIFENTSGRLFWRASVGSVQPLPGSLDNSLV